MFTQRFALIVFILLFVVGCDQSDDAENLGGTVAALAEQNAALATQNAALATQVATIPATATSTATATIVPTATITATAVSTATATSTTTPSPTATRPRATAPPPPPPTAVPQPQLVDWYLRDVTALPENGRRATLVWRVDQVPPGAEVRIFANTQQRFQPWWVVEPAGEMTVDLGRTIYPDPWLVLIVSSTSESIEYGSWSVQLPWPCQYDYFFEPRDDFFMPCPQEPPQSSTAAEQYFENGRMLWLESLDQIIVFYEDGRHPGWQAFEDLWQEGDPDIDPTITPPANRYQPVRGFNKVWLEQPNVRERLGWGVAPEEIFTAAYQRPEYEATVGAATLYVGAIDDQALAVYGYDITFGIWEVISR